MTGLFLNVINMSISASWLILAVLICRLVLKKAPKWINVLLWGIVAARLLFPFSIESDLSLIPSAETISPEIMMDATPTIHTGIPAINSAVNPIISQAFAPSPIASANPLQIWIPVLAIVWIVGAAVLLAYTAISFWLLRGKVDTAVLFRDNIFQSEHVSSPFVLGVTRPKIYLPFKIDGQDMEHVVAHELAHIRRRDHWWKPLGFLLLTVHWFNPLMWLAYVLLCRDIELACDEKVIKALDHEQRADYTQALLACSVSRRTIAACPLAFGEIGVKERVTSVMNYRKPAFWTVVLAVLACGVVAVCFLTNPVTRHEALAWAQTLSADEVEQIELVVMPQTPDKQYRLFSENEIETVVSFINNSKGKSVKSHEGINGSSIFFYIAMKDGSTHTIGNNGNVYLVVDGSYFGAPYEWLSTWGDDYGAGNSAIPDGFFDKLENEVVNASALSLNDVIALSRKGQDLSWADFEKYDHVDVGSGLYIWRFEINELFSLLIGGASTDTEIRPMYIRLAANDGTDSYIDIRDGGVTEFIDLHKDNPAVSKRGAGQQHSPVGRLR